MKFDEIERLIQQSNYKLQFEKYLKEFRGKTIVVKYGGSALEEEKYFKYLVEDLIFMRSEGIPVLLLHGGARRLDEVLKEKRISFQVIEGIRVTSKEVLREADKVFREINHWIVRLINEKGAGKVKAIAFHGSEVPVSVSVFFGEKEIQTCGKDHSGEQGVH